MVLVGVKGVQFGKIKHLQIGLVTNLFKGFCNISFAAKTILLFFLFQRRKVFYNEKV